MRAEAGGEGNAPAARTLSSSIGSAPAANSSSLVNLRFSTRLRLALLNTSALLDGTRSTLFPSSLVRKSPTPPSNPNCKYAATLLRTSRSSPSPFARSSIGKRERAKRWLCLRRCAGGSGDEASAPGVVRAHSASSTREREAYSAP